jgi:hypothetical protein
MKETRAFSCKISCHLFWYGHQVSFSCVAIRCLCWTVGTSSHDYELLYMSSLVNLVCGACCILLIIVLLNMIP